MRCFLISSLALLVAGPAIAQQSWSFNAELPENICISQCDAENAAYATQVARMRAVFDVVTPELDAVLVWMDQQGFAKPSFPPNGPNGTSRVNIIDQGESRSEVIRRDWENVLGAYNSADGMSISAIEVSGYSRDGTTAITLDNSAKDTIAHEVYHAVQETAGTIEGESWVVEGMAEFVGNAYVRRGNGRDVNYAVPLHMPPGDYDRAHFFHRLGRDFGGASRLAHLASFEQAYDDDGLTWVDNFLTERGTSLADYFPDFIARYVPDGADYFGASGDRGQVSDDDTPEPKVMAGGVGDVDYSIAVPIQPNAAKYLDVSPVFEGDFVSLEDEDRIYVNRISLTDPSDATAVSLVVRDVVVDQGASYLEPMLAGAGVMDTPYNVRLPNMSFDPTDSRDQTSKVRLSTTRVEFDLPACIGVGESVGILGASSLSRDEIVQAFSSPEVNLRASSGSVSNDLIYTAGSDTGPVEITASLPTIDGGRETVTLVDSRIATQGCMIQLRMGEARITLDAVAGYTEFAGNGPEAMYMKDQSFAVFMDGGFQPIPAAAEAMMLNSFKGRFAGGALEGLVDGIDPETANVYGVSPAQVPDIQLDEEGIAALRDDIPAILMNGTGSTVGGDWGMHLMPQTFMTRFSWRNQRRNPANPRRTGTACPAFAGPQDAPCSSTTITIEGNPVSVIYTDDGWPLVVNLPGVAMEIETGTFPIRRPPGW